MPPLASNGSLMWMYEKNLQQKTIWMRVEEHDMTMRRWSRSMI
jgi:hypothetical protein